MNSSKRLPVWLAYLSPVALWVYVYVSHAWFHRIGARLYREYGLVENLTALLLLAAVVWFLLCLRRAGTPWEKGWFLVLFLGAVYFLGEEISWGYNFFRLQIGEVWEGVNDQGEPNLHNLAGIWGILLDRLPRLLLSAGAVIGGLLGLTADRRPGWPRNQSVRRLLPAGNAFFIAVIANLVSLPEKIADHILPETPRWLVLGNRAGELKECFLALFIMLYGFTMWRNFRADGKPGQDRSIE